MKVSKPLLLASLLGLTMGVQAQGMSNSTSGANNSTNPSASSSANPGSAGRATSGAAMSDKDFAVQAAQSGMAEVELGKLAEKRASDPAVKQYAKDLVSAHSSVNKDLKRIAKSEKIKLPTKLSAQDKRDRDELNKLRGSDFDQRFLAIQAQDHQKAIDLFQREADQGRGQMKTFAQNNLPHLQDHLNKAQSLQSGNKTSHR